MQQTRTLEITELKKKAEQMRQDQTQASAREELERQTTFMVENRDLWCEGRRYFIMTYGCQLNENDSERIAGLLEEMGMVAADDVETADMVVLNTCSIRENAAGRFFGNLGIIKNLKRDRPDLITVACGCLMRQEPHVDRIRKSYYFVDLVFGPADIYRLPELLNRRLCDKRPVYEVSNTKLIVEDLPITRKRKYRALLSIMYGCNNFCTFCIVPQARGRERSRKPAAIFKELQELSDASYSEVMLLGQNVNSYGKDLRKSEDYMSFPDLLRHAASDFELPLIRFMSSHPRDIDEDLLRVMAEYPNIERHLHLPLQSGSDRILKTMNRHYTLEQYLKTAHKARELIDDLAITTDIIVGFPGETEEDFQATLDVMREVGYEQAFMFIYSPRPGTLAAKMDQLDPELVKERFMRMTELQNELSRRAMEAQVGREMLMLCEGLSAQRDDRFAARSSQNYLCNFSLRMSQLPERLRQLAPEQLGAVLEGRFARVKITGAKSFSLEGEMVELIL
ncbi:MAG: tRNA (N6-isopentenyl adenosine(37)-C2)-methylthiotransferase MiaB [Eubacteriales bacterium]|nr:tRNA (N6-isopentenyl adenosine(37)-C2)-methylthiotransferase MiaB [Eubacteriales bacterium]